MLQSKYQTEERDKEESKQVEQAALSPRLSPDVHLPASVHHERAIWLLHRP